MVNIRKPPNTRIERQIVTAMIVSSDFLKEISPLYSIHTQSPLSLPWAAIIADWSMEYFNRYKKAPGETIQDLFHSHTKSIRDQTQIELIEKFLSGISDEYEENEENENNINIPYLLDEAEKHFRLQMIKHTYEDIKHAISRNDIDQAESIIGGFKRIARPETVGVDPIGDMSVIEDAFNSEDRDLLFHLPGHLGAISEFLGPFERGSLIAFMGKEGAGKSWFLQQLALESVLLAHNALFVSMEMSQMKMVRRMHQFLNMETKKGKTGDVLIPVFDCKLNQENNCSDSRRICNVGILDQKGQKPKWIKEKIDGEYRIKFYPRISTKYKPCTACRGEYNWRGETWFIVKRKRGLSVYKAKNKGRALTESMLKGKKMKFLQYPVGTKSMSDLIINLQNMIFYEDFYPDTIITDYASKFLPESKEEKRHQLRSIYEKHKAIAQELRIQMITAHQTNVTRKDDKMGSKAITKGSWQETMAPQAECDKTFAINQTALEKRDGVMKLNMLKQRDDDYDQLKELTILYSHDLGRAILDSEILKKWD